MMQGPHLEGSMMSFARRCLGGPCCVAVEGRLIGPRGTGGGGRRLRVEFHATADRLFIYIFFFAPLGALAGLKSFSQSDIFTLGSEGAARRQPTPGANIHISRRRRARVNVRPVWRFQRRVLCVCLFFWSRLKLFSNVRKACLFFLERVWEIKPLSDVTNGTNPSRRVLPPSVDAALL